MPHNLIIIFKTNLAIFLMLNIPYNVQTVKQSSPFFIESSFETFELLRSTKYYPGPYTHVFLLFTAQRL